MSVRGYDMPKSRPDRAHHPILPSGRHSLPLYQCTSGVLHDVVDCPLGETTGESGGDDGRPGDGCCIEASSKWACSRTPECTRQIVHALQP